MSTTYTQTEELAIDVRGLRKSYGELEAVRGVSFEVARGEVFCLLGPNGAGKTTTVEILEGYRERTGGEVTVLGIDPASGSRRLHERVGIVLQQCGVQRDLTVAELLEMYGRYHVRRAQAPPARRPASLTAGRRLSHPAVDELIELVELGEKRDTRAKDLSGGQRRRLDLALALVGDPDLVFLDEPTTGFDPAARRHAWSTIKSLCELGKTVFLTTHYMDEAQYLADRIAVMRGGEIIAAGRPDELGGRSVRPAEIRFVLPAGWSLGDLPEVPALSRSMDGDRVLVVSGEPVAATHTLTGWALERGLELERFSVSRPTLEDIYLELTGGRSGEQADIHEEVAR